MAETLNDPSRFFIGGSVFAKDAGDLRVQVKDVPQAVAPNFPPLWMTVKPDLLEYYAGYVNGLIDDGKIQPPLARLDKVNKRGMIINPGRGIRPIGGESPIKPGNEEMTPPSFLQIGNRDGWYIRVFVNAFAYGYPRRQIFEEGPESRIRIENVPLLSMVAALNPRKSIYNMDFETQEFMQLWGYALAEVTQMIRNRGIYNDKTDGQKKRWDSVIAFGNIAEPEFIKDAGGSVETPHFQIIAYPKDYAPSFFEGIAQDEDGNCGRCFGIEEKLSGGIAGRIIAVRQNALLYVPETETAVKGESIRISPRTHISNWNQAFEQFPAVVDMVDLAQRGMYAMTVRQGKPALNVVWAQGQDGHMFTQIQTGTPAGGFSIVGPVFRIGSGGAVEIRPDTTYFDPETIAKEYRTIETIFPPQLNSL